MKNLFLFTLLLLAITTDCVARQTKNAFSKKGISVFIENYEFRPDNQYCTANLLISNTSDVSKTYIGTPADLAKLFCVNKKFMKISYVGVNLIFDKFIVENNEIKDILTAEKQKDTATVKLIIPAHHSFLAEARFQFSSFPIEDSAFKIGMYDFESSEIDAHNLDITALSKQSLAWSQKETIEPVPHPHDAKKYERHMKKRPITSRILTQKEKRDYLLIIPQNEVSSAKDTVYDEYVGIGKTKRVRCGYIEIPVYITNKGDSTLTYMGWSCSPWDVFKSDSKLVWIPMEFNCLNDKPQETVVRGHQTLKIMVPLFVDKGQSNKLFRIGLSVQGSTMSSIELSYLVNTPKTSNMLWSNEVQIP